MEDNPSVPPVWARREVALSTCPKSYITAESGTILEEFGARRRLGCINAGELTGRQAEAFVILEKALTEELKNERESRRSITQRVR